ncbi:MAG: antA/AntB antirepressor family protein [Prevotellaceae bacterium]|jgi:phage anti-repressor protein|nr:antA/AntB antirepressor family protein [Prevotellaceae bacterium]
MERKELEIIPIERGELGLEVNSRLLHRKLQVKTVHSRWIERRIDEYGFVEGLDFLPSLAKSTGGRRSKEYVLTLDTAKELAMLENNEEGRMIRRYFIEIEKRYRDWIGFILPRLETETDLFGKMTGYNYVKLLMSCGCSVVSSSVRRRIRRNPREFWKNQHGQWVVSEMYGRTIVANAVTRKLNGEARERRMLGIDGLNNTFIK